jgi:hypothetical protein
MITDAALDDLFSKPAFTNLGEERAASYRSFAEDIDEKNPAEIALRFIKLQRSKELRLTKEERAAVSKAISESLSGEDSRKLNAVLKLI